ncbi:type VI secretion system protein TssL, long form [Imhoffiella purpurea]|uniref:Flagellar motor rotation protein MotB n=1 Tax=Imhoffiella purpurea TaxID=1249627 RepID=W9W2F1_9GAMM|nr:type VI secretion system protein TssL, long form [Imhoffiella purpurea]EXJ16755.1 Flagellar motor rotation protein MotB [Imhoffiella purpurea]
MEETECECPDPPAGAPEWMATFADLMSLMMCFFVLLLSFSEMDVLKYKQIAGSMKAAFGVQREVKVSDIPTGTSIIAQEFSPAQPQPTLVNEVRQQTMDEMRQYLQIEGQATTEAEAREDAEKKAEEIREMLKQEISEGLLEVSTIEDLVIIRIQEKGSFESASARISPDFRRMLEKIGEALDQVEGKIMVAGHTDNIPIQSAEFPSNWVLSAARAAAVADTMTRDDQIDPQRVEIRAYGENKPLASNDSAEGRAQNRRVEIIVLGDASAREALEDISGLDLSSPTKANP